jgi:hypothetical protein
MNDLQNAWQNQPTEVFKMSAQKLRRKAQELDRRARVAVLVTAAIAILLFLWFGWGFLSFPEKFQNFGLGPFGSPSVRQGFGVLSLWGLYHGYRTYKVLWPSLASSDADLKTTLQSYRQQLEKRRDYTKKIWLKSGLILCFLGIAMVVMPVLVRDSGCRSAGSSTTSFIFCSMPAKRWTNCGGLKTEFVAFQKAA